MARFMVELHFTKKGDARVLSHRELMTFFSRVVRRANIPVKTSEGFNPRPRISFPTALGLGIESDDELVYFVISEWMNPDEITRRLKGQLISGIEITDIRIIQDNKAPLVRGIEYKIDFNSHEDVPSLDNISEFMNKEEFLIERVKKDRTQTKDIKKFINETKKIDDRTIFLSVKHTPSGSLNPREFLNAFGIKGDNLTNGKINIRKTKTLLEEK